MSSLLVSDLDQNRRKLDYYQGLRNNELDRTSIESMDKWIKLYSGRVRKLEKEVQIYQEKLAAERVIAEAQAEKEAAEEAKRIAAEVLLAPVVVPGATPSITEITPEPSIVAAEMPTPVAPELADNAVVQEPTSTPIFSNELDRSSDTGPELAQ